jgi:uncharacterized protein
MHKPSPSLDRALSDDEQEQLASFLSGLSNPDALDFEGLDGFLCALVVGPETILPSEYLPVIWGGELSDADAFQSEAQFSEVLTGVMRHSNAMIRAFEESGVYVPWMYEASDTWRLGQRWAQGFMRGVDLRRAAWGPLLHDGEVGGAIIPVALLAGELEPDWLQRPVTTEEQQKHAELMLAGCVRMYEYFRAARLQAAHAARDAGVVRRSAPKVGRNAPCPCGSGRKFKHCCGAPGREVH